MATIIGAWFYHTFHEVARVPEFTVETVSCLVEVISKSKGKVRFAPVFYYQAEPRIARRDVFITTDGPLEHIETSLWPSQIETWEEEDGIGLHRTHSAYYFICEKKTRDWLEIGAWATSAANFESKEDDPDLSFEYYQIEGFTPTGIELRVWNPMGGNHSEAISWLNFFSDYRKATPKEIRAVCEEIENTRFPTDIESPEDQEPLDYKEEERVTDTTITMIEASNWDRLKED